MSETDLVIRGQRVALSEPHAVDASESATRIRLAPASIHISHGVITGIAGYDDVPTGCASEEADEHVLVMPGLVDSHVHINEPGRTEWEGFATATHAAAAGGVT